MTGHRCAGTDPKSILCEYFRHGQCTKGFKCKFSHDLSVERKGGKIDVFSDRSCLLPTCPPPWINMSCQKSTFDLSTVANLCVSAPGKWCTLSESIDGWVGWQRVLSAECLGGAGGRMGRRMRRTWTTGTRTSWRR